MRSVVVIQARLDSTRLPNKILAPLGGSTMLEQIVRRCRAAKRVDEVVVACPTKDEQAIFQATGIAPIAGPEEDVLSRLLIAAVNTKADRIVRVTADCPLTCPRMIDQMLDHHVFCKMPVVTNAIGHTFPDGLDLEVYTVKWLQELSGRIPPQWREYFAQWVAENHKIDVVERIINPDALGKKYRLTVDWPEDLELVRRIYEASGSDIWDSKIVLDWLVRNPQVARMNAHRADGTFGWKKKEAK